MLSKIREKIVGWVGLTILILIGVTFVFFGGANFIISGNQFAAKVDGSEIGIVQLEQAYQFELQANPALATAPPEQQGFVRQQLLQSLILERLLQLHLIDDGYQISDQDLTSTIRNAPDFRVDGVFSKEAYDSYLISQGMSARQYEEELRSRLRTGQLQRAVGGTSIVTPAEYRRYLNLVAEQRLISTATFETATVAEGIDVSEEQVTAFYDENDTMFLTEERVDVEFIEVRRDVIAEGIEISEEALQRFYEENQSRYLQEEQRRARHILILPGDDAAAAEAGAAELLARVRSGESFADLAAEHSDDGGTASNGGDLGVLTQSQLPGELGEAIFSMQEGDLDGPIESDFGFHIVQLDEILAPGPLPLDQVRGELLTELRDRESEDAFRALEGQVSDALFDAPDMPTIAAATGLEVQAATGFTRFGGDPIGSNQAAIDAVFDSMVLEDGQISEIIELDANRSAIFKVTEHYEASRQPLEDVRDSIVAAIQEQEARTIVFSQVEQLMAALDAGEEFGAAAEAAGASVSQPTLIGRNAEGIDVNLRSQVFLAKKPAMGAPTIGQVANIDGGYTVFTVDAVLPGRPESIPLAERDAGKLQLAQQAGSSDFLAFMQALYNRADIVISEDVLAARDPF